MATLTCPASTVTVEGTDAMAALLLETAMDVSVGCAAASMRYHDEIRVFSRLMAKSVVGNNQ